LHISNRISSGKNRKRVKKNGINNDKLLNQSIIYNKVNNAYQISNKEFFHHMNFEI